MGDESADPQHDFSSGVICLAESVCSRRFPKGKTVLHRHAKISSHGQCGQTGECGAVRLDEYRSRNGDPARSAALDDIFRHAGCDQDEAAASSDRSQGSGCRAVSRVTDEIENQVDFVDDVFERDVGIVDEGVCAQGTKPLVLRFARRRDDRCAEAFRDLDREMTDTAPRSQNQYALTSRDLPRVDQTLPRRQTCKGKGGSLVMTQRWRLERKLPRGASDKLCIGACRAREPRHPEDLVSRLEQVLTVTHLLHYARHVPPEHMRCVTQDLGRRSGRAASRVPIDRIYASRVDLHKDFRRLRNRSWQHDLPHHFRRTELLESHRAHHFRLLQRSLPSRVVAAGQLCAALLSDFAEEIGDIHCSEFAEHLLPGAGEIGLKGFAFEQAV